MRNHLNLYIIRSDSLEMLCEESSYCLAVLVRHKSHRNLRMSDRRKHGLRTFTDVTTPDAVHVKTRTDAGTLKSRITRLTLDLIDIKEFLILIHIERST